MRVDQAGEGCVRRVVVEQNAIYVNIESID